MRSESEYRVEGFVRLSGMSSARACVSAHFLDKERRPLLATSRRTAYIPQQPGVDWVPIELHLPAAPDGAWYLGLAVWILQEETWNTAQRAEHIAMVDVAAEAWFDDISVYRLPRLEITTRAAGEVIDEQSDAALWVTLADSLEPQVNAELTLASVDGTEVLRRGLVGGSESAQAIRIALPGLEPGLYDARVEVVDRGRKTISRTLRFLKLAPLGTDGNRNSRAFGIVIDPHDRADLASESALLRKNSARSVNLPVWPAWQSPFDDGRREKAIEQFYHELLVDQFLLNATLSEAPTKLRADRDSSAAVLLSILAGNREAWWPELARVAAQTASVFRSWEIGTDGESVFAQAGQLKGAAQQLRDALREYITVPRLAVPISANDETSGLSLPVEQVTVSVKTENDLLRLPEKIKELKDQGCEAVCVYAPSLSPDRYVREARLAEWGRRLIQSRHAGADVVYVPQPWKCRDTFQGIVVEPQEEYSALRTVAAMLGDARPGPVMSVAEHIKCLTFRSATESVLAIWDQAPPPQGRTIPMQLGSANRQVDLWGRVTSLGRDSNGRQMVAVSQSPVFIDHVDSWVVDLATSVSLEPTVIESGTELVRQELVLNCAATMPRSGNGLIVPPPGIEVVPRTFAFTVCAGEPVRIPVVIHYPHNEPAGVKQFVAKVSLVEPAYQFEIPMFVELRSQDLEVSGRATIERGDLLLRHTLHNKSQVALSFRSIAAVPGRQRQYRPISSLAPGETQTVEYRFRDATDLIGRKVNIALRELNDGPRQHNLQLIIQ